MKILGMDTSGAVCTAALTDGRNVLGSFSYTKNHNQSAALLPGIKELLESANVSLDALDAIAVSCGPGSYTGLRIGIATAKGLAVPFGIPCIALSSLEALCCHLPDDYSGYVCALLDARREEFYAAVFSLDAGKIRRVTEDQAILFSDLESEISRYPGIILIGDGAEKYARLCGKNQPALPAEWNLASGVCVCRLALLSGEDARKPCQTLSPRYCKLSQAEREYNERIKGERK